MLRATLITVQRTTSPTALVGSAWLTKCDQLRDMTLLPARTDDLTGIQLGPPAFHSLVIHSVSLLESLPPWAESPPFSGCTVAAQQLGGLWGPGASLMSLLTCSVLLPAWHGVLRCGDRVPGGGNRPLSRSQVSSR